MKKTYLLAFTSIFFWSTIATVSKLLLATMNSYQMLAYSSGFAFLAFLVLNLVTGNWKVLKNYCAKDYLTLVLIGLPGTFFYYVFYYAGTKIMLASQAFIVNYLWPIMSVLFACLLLKQRLTVRKIVAIAVSFLGVFTVAGSDLIHFNTNTLLGALFCVLGAVSYGLFTALNQKFCYDKRIATMFFFLVAFLLSNAVNLVAGTPVSVTAPQLLGLAYNGIFVMATASTTWALALESGKTAKISNFAYITPFLSLVWTSLILKEALTAWSIAGLCIIILGILIQLNDKKEASL